MGNMKKVPCKSAEFFILEGDIMAVNNGEFPITYVGVRFEDAPEDQIWILNKPLFGYFEEDYVVSSHSLAIDEMNKMHKNKTVNLMDDFETISSFEEDYLPYGSYEYEKRSTIHIVKSYKNESDGVKEILKEEPKVTPEKRQRNRIRR